jgi:hypothetical protein
MFPLAFATIGKRRGHLLVSRSIVLIELPNSQADVGKQTARKLAQFSFWVRLGC